jgi:hypothetical protein
MAWGTLPRGQRLAAPPRAGGAEAPAAQRWPSFLGKRGPRAT